MNSSKYTAEDTALLPKNAVETCRNTSGLGIAKYIRTIAIGLFLGVAVAGCTAIKSNTISDNDLRAFLGRYGLMLPGVQRDGVYIAIGYADRKEDAITKAKTDLLKRGYKVDETYRPIIESPTESGTDKWLALFRGIKIDEQETEKNDTPSPKPEAEPENQPTPKNPELKPGETKMATDGIMELEKTAKLRVNTGKTHYRIKGKSRASGENDLYGLCETADVEENFIYVKYKDGTEEWEEFGIKETNGGVKGKMKHFTRIYKNPAGVAELSIVHFHPVKKHPKQDPRFDISQTFSAFDIEEWAAKAIRDILIHDTKKIDNIDFRVVTTTGIYIIKFSPRAVKRIGSFNKRIARHSDILYFERKDGFPRFNYRYTNRRNFVKLNRKFAKKFSRKWIKIRFMPKKTTNSELAAAK